ncbi:desmoplakin-like protein [Lymantria xylina nucleopolyhedrovirus]|uniref:Desmoplakin-like protein n=1 Tax=Lymantria xylina multiple nucleopolyhedrovirus TaxID=2847840 RepID=D4N2B5_9ABAC|nr:desmoplakin-like protein [Lymantria xylina nucleopolyhedrovirus]ADD73787.1 desmoplakin-like protein [Lymantria xylina nucleopolyhedrovirus]
MRVMRAVSSGPMETGALPASWPACNWVFNADHFIRFADRILDMSANRYRAPARYINADVSVDNLLRTIDSMSRQCRSRNETESELARIRSIITLYRPHLQNRVDLQVAELVIEALMPPNNAQQITHNFNYKYDYNTNAAPPFNTNAAPPPPPPPPFFPVVPARPTDAFGAPIAPSEPTPTPPSKSPNPIQQNVYINSTGEAARPPSQNPKPPPPASGAVARMQTDDADQLALQNDYDALTREYTLVSYKRLIRTLVTVSQKYIINDLFVRSLVKLCSIELLLNNDLGALVDCINREMLLNIRYDTPDLCRLLVALIRGFFTLASSVMQREFSLTQYDSVVLVEEQVWSVKTTLDQKMNMLFEELEASRNALSETVLKLNRVQLELNEARRNASMLKNQVNMNEALRQRPALLGNDLAQSRDRALEVQSRDLVLESELEKERSRARSLEEELARARRELDSVSERQAGENVRAQRDLESAQTRHADELARVRRELRERHDNDIKQVRLESQAARRAETSAKRQQTEDLLNNLNSRLEAQTSMNVRLQTEAEELADVNARLRAEIDSFQRDSRTIESDVSVLQSRIAQLEAAAASEAARGAQLETELSGLTKKLQESTAEVLALRRDKEDLERRTAASAAQDASYNQLQEDIERVKNDLSRLTDSSDGVQFDILKLNNLRDQTLRDRLQELQSENDRLREGPEREIERQAESINASVNDQFDRIKRTIDEFKNKQRQYEKSEKEYVQKYELLARAVTRDKLTAELVPRKIQKLFEDTAFSTSQYVDSPENLVSSSDDII